MRRTARLACWSAASLVLLAVFASYLRPDVAVMLANQLWSCF